MRVSDKTLALLRGVQAVEWLYLMVGIALVHRYFWLFDDAFVYFRYVDNLLFLNLGLVYNAGEYVEGFSSPAQALVLIALRSLGLSYPVAVEVLGDIAFVTFWAWLVATNRHWSPPGPRLNLPLALLCANYGLTSYFTSGLETPLVHVTAAAYALAVAAPGARAPRACVYGSPLVRPELAVPLALYLMWRWRNRRQPLHRLLLWPLALNGSWLVFRIVYYADLLPNTFYLKDDFQPMIGLYYLWDLVRSYDLVVVAIVGLSLVYWLRVRCQRPDLHLRERALLIACAAAVAAYVIKVGGGAVHYWYLAFPFTLSIAALAGLLEHVLATTGRNTGSAVAQVAMVVVTAASFSLYPSRLSSHPALSTARLTLVDLIVDPAWHRNYPPLAPRSFMSKASAARQRAQAAAIAARGYPRWTTAAWCRDAYVELDAGVVHSFGLTDAVLARTEVPELKQGHKVALIPLAKDLLAVREREPPGRGMYRAAVAAGYAAPWIGRNLSAIEQLAAKIYNDKDPRTNLRLALSRSPRIVP